MECETIDSQYQPDDNLELSENIFQDYHKQINDKLRDITGSDQYDLQDSTMMIDLLESVATDCFWDDLISQHRAESPVNSFYLSSPPLTPIKESIQEDEDDIEEPTEDNSLIAKALLNEVVLFGDVLQQFSDESSQFIETARNPLNMKELLSFPQDVDIDETNTSNHQLDAFIHSENFWTEILNMQQEVIDAKNIQLPLPTSIEADMNLNEVQNDSSEEIIKEGIIKDEIEQPSTDKDKAIINFSIEKPRNESSSNIVTSTLWEDIDVAVLKPAKQLTLDKVSTSENTILSSIAEEIDQRATKGPNLQYAFTLLIIATVSIFLVSVSHSVKEHQYLFRILWILAFMINFITVSIPGRLDRVIVAGNHIKPWSSLFEASTWAFAIWGIIYLSETILSGYVGVVGIPVKLFQKIIPYWLAGNWFQGLWCFAFRPEFKSRLYIPTFFLLLGSITFTAAHREITLFLRNDFLPLVANSVQQLDIVDTKQGTIMQAVTYILSGIMNSRNYHETILSIPILLFRVPFAMHGAWLAAATLLNFNSYIALSNYPKSLQIAIANYSAFSAFVYGLYFSIYYNDCILSLTVAWALEAVAHRSMEKMRLPGNLVSADVHESLSVTENILSGVLKCVSLGILAKAIVA